MSCCCRCQCQHITDWDVWSNMNLYPETGKKKKQLQTTSLIVKGNITASTIFEWKLIELMFSSFVKLPSFPSWHVTDPLCSGHAEVRLFNKWLHLPLDAKQGINKMGRIKSFTFLKGIYITLHLPWQKMFRNYEVVVVWSKLKNNIMQKLMQWHTQRISSK